MADRMLWLWRNHVDGRPEFWAFDNPYPCESVGGDPLTLGEPCGYAIVKESVNGRPNRSEAEAMARIAPVPRCKCGQPWVLNTVHRVNTPCYRAADPADGLGVKGRGDGAA